MALFLAVANVKLNMGGLHMVQKMILVPEWQYYKMLESYDKTMKELEELKKALKEAATSKRAE